MSDIIPSRAPSLQLAPEEYERRQQDQLNNQLRLYFNTLDANSRGLIASSNSADTMIWLGWGS